MSCIKYKDGDQIKELTIDIESSKSNSEADLINDFIENNKLKKKNTVKKNINPNKIIKKTKKTFKKRNDKNNENKFLKKWFKIMAQKKLYNRLHDTFSPQDIQHTSYGYTTNIYIPDGFSADDLEKNLKILQNNLGCTISLKTSPNKQYIKAEIIFIENCNKIAFKPVEAAPYEIFLGVNPAGEPIIININIDPHVLIAGTTRKGKNGVIDHIVPNLIYNNQNGEIDIHLVQGAKGDMVKYRNCKQVKTFNYCTDLSEVATVFQNIKDEMTSRKALMEEMIENFKGDNLYAYNKLHKDNQLPYVYVILDEFMSLSVAATKDKDEDAMFIIKTLEEIAQYGGAYGVTYIISHQKPEKELMPSFLKNQSNVRVGFGVNDSVCSEIVLGQGNTQAVKLPPRKAYVVSSSYEGYLYTTNLKNRIQQYIKPSIANKNNIESHNTNATPRPSLDRSNTVEDNLRNILGVHE